jgi:hypothetical protein
MRVQNDGSSMTGSDSVFDDPLFLQVKLKDTNNKWKDLIKSIFKFFYAQIFKKVKYKSHFYSKSIFMCAAQLFLHGAAQGRPQHKLLRCKFTWPGK